MDWQTNSYKGGDRDGFVTKLDASSGNILWSLLVGGSSGDQVTAVGTDSNGYAYVAGNTGSSDINPPRTNEGPDFLGGSFFTKVKGDGTVQWSTYGLVGQADWAASVFPAADGMHWWGITGGGCVALDTTTGERAYYESWGVVFGISPGVRSGALGAGGDLFVGGETPGELPGSLGPWEWKNAYLSRIDFEPCDDPYEPNDDPAEAFDLGGWEGLWLNQVQGQPSVADYDWYTLWVDAGSSELVVDLQAPAAVYDFMLMLFDASLKEVAVDFGGSWSEARIRYPTPAPGTYFLRVSPTILPGGGLTPNRCAAYDLRWDDGIRVTTKPTVDFSADKLVGAASLNIQFQDLTTPPARAWSWTFGDGAVSTAKHPSHIYAEPGWYNVSLVATVGAGTYARQKPDYVHVILDQDEVGAGDGMDDTWEVAYFGHDRAKPGDDADGDGISNLEEFRSGTDPVTKGSVLAVLTFQVHLEGTVKLGFQAIESFNYQVQVRNTLDPTGEWIGLASVRAACTCTLEVTVPRYPDRSYYRIAVTR